MTLGLSAIDIEEGLRKDSEAELRVRKPESCHEYHLHYWCEERRVWREATYLKWFCSLPYLSLSISLHLSSVRKVMSSRLLFHRGRKRIFYVSMRHIQASNACIHNNPPTTTTNTFSRLTHSLSFSVLARSAAVHLFTSSPYLKVPVSLCSARKMEWFNQWDRGEIRSLYRCKWCNAPRAQ